jgi:hypothetical protein
LGCFGDAEAWRYFFALPIVKAVMGMATSKRAIIIHTHMGIFTIQDEGLVSSLAPFGGLAGAGPG